jgi:hypothetical protein
VFFRVNRYFYFCVLLIFPSFCTFWKSLCRFEVDESLFVASQIPTIRDSLTPKSNEVPYLLFILKFISVDLLLKKNYGTRVSKQALTRYNESLRRYSIRYYCICEQDTDCLDPQYQWKRYLHTFLLTGHWRLQSNCYSFQFLEHENTPRIVVIGLQAIFMTGHKERYSLSRMLKDFAVWKFPLNHKYFHL